LISEQGLIKRLTSQQACIIEFARNRLILDASGTLYWPAYDLLVFSDLHFEKGSFLSQFANPLPRIDTQKTLDNMQNVLITYQPTSVICLGDSFHDGNAISRMDIGNIEVLNNMVNSVLDWLWVLGNHDPEIPREIAGGSLLSLKKDNLLLVHEPEDLCQSGNASGTTEAQIVGHFHPKMRIKKSGHTMSGKCFVVGHDILLMPAFGQYTGGLSIEHKVIKRMLGEKSSEYLLYAQKIFNIK
jgi:DNA ligase-associated metallophosphoesterase